VFNDLYDAISMLGNCRWPIADGEITPALFERIPSNLERDTMGLVVAYKFSVGNDGPVSGETCWEPLFPKVKRLQEARAKFLVGQHIRVRYRAGDPSVNRCDRRTPTRLSLNSAKLENLSSYFFSRHFYSKVPIPDRVFPTKNRSPSGKSVAAD
jgi:hypothetical protein